MIDNNFFISNSTLSYYSLKSKQIQENIQAAKTDKNIKVSKDEHALVEYTNELFFKFNSRVNICKGLDVHYWVIDNTDEPYLAYCYFCDIRLTEWTKKNREKT